MVAALKSSTRRGMNILTHWTTDRGTYPVVFCAGFAATAASCLAIRNVTKNPDVFWNKTQRELLLHHDEEAGDAYFAHRFTMANAKRNPINQSHQFDVLFEKPENQNVKR